MAQSRGIDISRWQGHINWDVVKSNIDFAIIKIGGSDVGFYKDGYADRNVLEARAHKIPRGFYFYLGGAHTPAEEVEHIKNTISSLGGLQPGEVLALDWEEHHNDEVWYLQAIVEKLIAFNFPPPLIYMSLSRVTGNNWKSLVNMRCGLWVAAWGNNDATPSPNEVPGSDEWPFWAVWQFSSTGTIPGIAGRVDLNIYNGAINTFASYGAHQKTGNYQAQPTKPAINNASDLVQYTVKPGDNLSVIAAKYKKSWQELWAINRDRVSQPNRIFPGQVLRVWGTHNDVKPATPNPPLPTPTHNKGKYHIVQRGDNLSAIADKHGYGAHNWRTIYDANREVIGRDPNRIFPGQKLRLP